ncbi:hypothetical protein H6F43_11950 [Leptolyngbya sp. FACHB-36]|uniref:hypothetical protein n=1 Tax=Leptolyngbya sp. FACHB-36 TaxID=2692808 RepID=UPI00168144BE|nr:hypothetical protein [Leptolyngbya sp. FACHB-36]MBD2020891.1 hypothetical protein [Leptolyngbya sp. FACHB-36]
MNTKLLGQAPWVALSLLGVEYTLLGWYLAAHHLSWLVGTFVVVTTFAIAWKSHPIVDSLTWLISRQLFVVLSISFLVSVVVTLILVQPLSLNLILLPLITLLYALLEMRAANFQQTNIFVWLVLITALGLGIGEAVDLFIAPSMRY